MVPNRHSTKNLQSSESICYSSLTEQQRERELNVQANIKIKNRKELQLQTLVDSEYIYTGINKQLVKEERIKMKPADISFKRIQHRWY